MEVKKLTGSVEVIILAQGNQTRLRGLSGYKQMQPLPSCGGAPILARTLQQLCRIVNERSTITMVAWPGLGQFELRGQSGESAPEYRHVTLPSPGNSSLKGISRYLELRGERHTFSSTLVLLGDVVYSWACLDAIARSAGTWGFVGTSDLNGSRGELWGVAWDRDYETQMMSLLADAMLRHPPFDDDYQPGQMRRWISGFRRGDLADHRDQLAASVHYRSIDDYTRDIDLPSHVSMLPALSMSAAADDAAHGMMWEQEPTIGIVH